MLDVHLIGQSLRVLAMDDTGSRTYRLFCLKEPDQDILDLLRLSFGIIILVCFQSQRATYRDLTVGTSFIPSVVFTEPFLGQNVGVGEAGR